jgi:hypothetical protein
VKINIDPFSFPNAIVVHYLVNKNDIIKLAEEAGSYSSSSSNAAAGSMKKTNAPVFALNNATTQFASHTSTVAASGLPVAAMFGFVPGLMMGFKKG